MALGQILWTDSEDFYRSLTLAEHGIAPEQSFARRPWLAAAFANLEEFWQYHICPATTRPYGVDFRPGISPIVCKIALTSCSIMGKLLDAEDSLNKVRAGDLGERCRNWRDAIEAAGNALQLTSELHYLIAGSPKKQSLASHLKLAINPFPDWQTNWAVDREMASKYRNYLVHEGHVYTVRDESTGKTLVLGRAAFAAGGDWIQAETSYRARPGDWESLESVCDGVFGDTVAFIDRTYDRLLDEMDELLILPAYQRLWGWDDSTPPATWPAQPPLADGGIDGGNARSTMKPVRGTYCSSGGCYS
jgi:hypothetical protein